MRHTFLITFMSGALLLAMPSAAQQQADEFSRVELFAIIRQTGSKPQEFALPPSFRFPKDARERSTFGVDYSHHNEDDCHCRIDWADLATRHVSFAYFKATQGTTYTDPTVLRNIAAVATTPIKIGLYRFLTTEPALAQANLFLAVVRSAGKTQLPPSLDLEWNLGPDRPDCPSNARKRLKRRDGSIYLKCDYWAYVPANTIIASANTWIDQIKNATGETPIVYTNAAWWSERIADPAKIAALHTTGLWIADYSRGGLATEKPAVPSRAAWRYWQFSERALVTATTTLKMDASIASQ